MYNTGVKRIVFLLFIFPLLCQNTSADEFDFFNPLSCISQTETVSYPPIQIDIRKGAILSPLEGKHSPKPKYESDTSGRLIEIDFANKSKTRIGYDKKDRVTKISGPGIKVLTLSYPNENTIILEKGKKKTIYEYSVDGKKLSSTDTAGNITLKEFDSSGNVTCFTDPSGNKTHFLYDNSGNLISVTNALGHKTEYTYDSNNRLSSITIPSGKVFRKYYDTTGNITQLTDPLSGKTAFSYNKDGKIISAINARGETIKCDYDGYGNAGKFTDPFGNITSIEYDPSGNIIKTVSPEGRVICYKYGADGSLIEETGPENKKTTYEYDEMGNLIKQIIDNKVHASYEYDVYGRLVSEKDVSGNKTIYAYDEDDNLISIKHPNGAEYKYDYDTNQNNVSITGPLGETTRYEFTPTNLLKTIFYPNNTSTYYEYDATGKMTSVTDIRGNKTSFTYDSDGNVISKTDSFGNTKNFTYNELSKLNKVVYPSGEELSYLYDACGNIVKISNNDGLTSQYFYDKLNRVVKIIDFKGNPTEYAYNSSGDLVKEIDSLGNTKEYIYKDGNLVEVRQPSGETYKYTYDSLGNLLSLSSKLGTISAQEFDSAGRVTKSKDILNHTLLYGRDADGNLISVSDYNGNTYKYSYGIDHRVTSITDPKGNLFKIVFDKENNSRTVIGPKEEQLLKQDYNNFGDLISKIDSHGAVTSYDYDNVGNLTAVVKPDKSVTRYNYDKLQRLIGATHSDGTTDQYTYDNYGNLLCLEGKDFKETYVYDTFHRMIETARDTPNSKVSYNYDKYDRRTKIAYPSGRTFEYIYDKFGRLSEIIDNDGNKFTFTYYNDGKIETIKYPNGVNSSYEYDPLGRAIKVEYRNSAGKIITGSNSNYDATGNKISTKKYTGIESKYSYDKNNQLSSHIPPAKDKCKYDTNSNVNEIEGTKFTYDSYDRLIKVEPPTGKYISYGYSPLDKRIWKEIGGEKVYYIYDDNNVIAEIKNDKITAEYVYGPYIDQPLALYSDGKIYYYHADDIGSITAITDTAQNIITSYDYDPWGNLIYSTGDIANPYLFTGREYESDACIYYLRARYYSPKLGQFLTKDPYSEDLTDPLTFNPYVYARNNPLTVTDPFGLKGGTVYFTDPMTGAERPMNLDSRGIPTQINLGTDTNGVPRYFSQGHMLSNADAMIHPTKGWVPINKQNWEEIQALRANGVPDMPSAQADRLWLQQNPRMVQKAKNARMFEEAMNPNLYRGPYKIKTPPDPSSPSFPFRPPTPDNEKPIPPGSRGATNRMLLRQQMQTMFPGRGPYGTTAQTGRPNMMPPVGGNPTGVGAATDPSQAIASILQALGRAGTDYVDQQAIQRALERFLGNLPAGHRTDATIFILRSAEDQETGNTPIVWGPRGPTIIIQTGRNPSLMGRPTPPLQYWTTQHLGTIIGTGPKPEELLNRMRQMTDLHRRIKDLLNNSDYWNRALGETVSGPRQVSTSSQAASGLTASSDIGLAQQQAIDRVKQQRANLEAVQSRIQDLIDQYNRSGGAVGNDWSQSWDRARNDWHNLISSMSLPQPGNTAGTETTSSGGCGSSSESTSSASGSSGTSGSGNPNMGQYWSGPEGPQSSGSGSASDMT